MQMNTTDLIQAISAGICFYAGVTHLMIGLRSQPRDRVHLSFAAVSLLFGVVSIAIFGLYVAVDSGSLARYLIVDKWSLVFWYLAFPALYWFIAFYTGARRGLVLWIITVLYVAIALSNFALPFTWVYTDIELNPTFPPDIVVAPWYSVEQVITWLLLFVFSAIHIAGQYRRGERGAARAMSIAIGIYLVTVLGDYSIEYGLIDTVLMAQYGFVAFIVIMSLRLSGQAVEAEKEIRRLNIELEDRVEERTAELSNANRALQKAKEAAETANRAKSVFLANMSHELRTPLNAILGFTQIMERDPSFPPQRRKNLETIDRSGKHLLDLINDVLEMSKIEAGRTNLEKTGFDLYNTLDSLESIMRVRAENKGLNLVFEREDDLPRYIRTDERKLRQVLINLLGNAIKFTKEGRVTLRVVTKDEGRTTKEQPSSIVRPSSPVPREARVLVFEVEDTGVGIDPQEMDQLFEPFRQTQSGLQVGEGTGLGLPISRQFVQLMGGDISVQSQVGQGSTFSFDVPLELAEVGEMGRERPTRRAVGLAPDQPSYRILVVDDSVENRELLRQMLEQVSFEVRTAVDGQVAIEEYQRWQPHLIWMDIRMPVLDGYQATKQIKAQAGASAPAVIAVTASAFEEERAKVLEAGCDDFVRKPFTEKEIFDTMAEHLGVRYVYEELSPPEGEADSAPARVALELADLAALPDGWLADLRDAAMRGRSRQLLDLIEHIEPDHASLARSLRAMVNGYQFRQIVALTE